MRAFLAGGFGFFAAGLLAFSEGGAGDERQRADDHGQQLNELHSRTFVFSVPIPRIFVPGIHQPLDYSAEGM
jgi:hypothetical protein